MSTTADSERILFACYLAKELPKIPPVQIMRLAQALIRHARTIDRHATNACNREVTAAETKRCNAAVAHITQLLETYAPKVRATYHGDPRGYVVKLHFPSGVHNTMGGPEDGYGVPVGN